MTAPLLQILLTPVAASAVIFLSRKRAPRLGGWISGLALLYATLLSIVIGFKVHAEAFTAEEYFLIAPDIRMGLLADGLSVPVLTIVLLLCTALAFFSIRYVEQRVAILYRAESPEVQAGYYARFFYLFPFFPVGFVGTILSTNLVSLYFFTELLVLTLFFLMAFFGYRDRERVAFMSLSWGIIGALLFFTGSLVVYSQIGSLEIADLHQLSGLPLADVVIVLFLVSLLMKLALVPFHVWMPWVHAEHPTCIAGLLAIYANLALYVIARVIVLPLRVDFQPFAMPLMALALVTMVYGSLLALAQTDIKRLAACSTISQIAYSVFGLCALTSAGVEGGVFFFLSHILGKTVFFSTAGIVVYTTGIRDIREMGGLARKMPLTAGLWVIGCMMLSGFPPFSSFTAEWIMFTGVFERGFLLKPMGIMLAVGGVLAILLTVAYSFGSARRIFFGPLSPALARIELGDPAWTMTAPLIVVALISILIGMYPGPVMELLHTVVGEI